MKKRAHVLCAVLAAVALETGVASPANVFPSRTPGAKVTTLAGNGVAGNADGAGAAVEFMFPMGIAFEPRTGAVYVADAAGQRIRRIDPQGNVTTVAGSGPLTDSGLQAAAGFADGPALEARFNRPSGIAVAPDGTLYVADSFNHCIRRVAGGVVTTYAGDPKHAGKSDGTVRNATFTEPRALALAADGTLYVGDFTIGVRSISPGGAVATLLTFNDVTGLAVWDGPPRELFVAYRAGLLRYDLATGEKADASGTPQQNAPFDPSGIVALGPDRVAIASTVHASLQFVRFPAKLGDKTGFSRLIGGADERDETQVAGFADGPPRDARFYAPFGLARNAHDDILVADAGNRRIRIVPALDERWAANVAARPPPKRAGSYQIVIVGGLTTFSNAVWDDSIGGTLERRLERDRAQFGLSRPVQVDTVRLDGADFGLQADYLDDVLALGAADVVVWALGTDAFDVPFAPTSADSLHVADPEWTKARVAHTRARLARAGARLLLVAAPSAGDRAFGRKYADLERLLGTLAASAIPTLPHIRAVEAGAHAPLFTEVEPAEGLAPGGNELVGSILAGYLEATRPWSHPAR